MGVMKMAYTRREFIESIVGAGAAIALNGCAALGGRQNEGLAKLIEEYKELKKIKDAPAETVKKYEAALGNAFDESTLQLYVGMESDMGERVHNVYEMGKGEKFKEMFNLDEKVAILSRASTEPVRYNVKGTIPREDVLKHFVYVKDPETTVPMYLQMAGGKFGELGSPAPYLDKEVWAAYNDGNVKNCEVRGTPKHVLVGAVYSGTPELEPKQEPKADINNAQNK